MQIQNQPNRIPATRVRLEVSGDAEGGQYEEMSGDGVQLSLTHQPSYSKIGGLLVENEGTYQAAGRFQELETKLNVVPEDQIAEVGGIRVQTGTVYHVEGNVGTQAVRGDIREEETIEKLDGIAIQSDSWKVFDGPQLHLEVRQDGDQHRVTGSDHGCPVNLTVEGLNGGEELFLSGQASAVTLAEVASLRPFLAV